MDPSSGSSSPTVVSTPTDAPCRDTVSSKKPRCKSSKAKGTGISSKGDTVPLLASRPANSFILYRKDFNKKYREEHSDSRITSQEISLLASKSWATASAEVRQYYEEAYLDGARKHREKVADHLSRAAATAAAAASDADDAPVNANDLVDFVPPSSPCSSQGRKSSLDAARSKASPYPTASSSKRSTSPARSSSRRSLDALQRPSAAKATAHSKRARSSSVSAVPVAKSQEKVPPLPPLPARPDANGAAKPSLFDGVCKAIGPEKAAKLAESLERRGFKVPQPTAPLYTSSLPSRSRSSAAARGSHFTLRTRNEAEYAALQDWNAEASYHATGLAFTDSTSQAEVFSNHVVAASHAVDSAFESGASHAGPDVTAYYSDAMLEQMGLCPRSSQAPHEPVSHSENASAAQQQRCGHSSKQQQEFQQHEELTSPHQQQPQEALRRDSEQQRSQTPNNSQHLPMATDLLNETSVIDDLLHAMFPPQCKPPPMGDIPYTDATGLGSHRYQSYGQFGTDPVVTEEQAVWQCPSVLQWQNQAGHQTADGAMHAFKPGMACDGATGATLDSHAIAELLRSVEAEPNSRPHLKQEEVDAFQHHHSLDEFGVLLDPSLLLTQSFQPPEYGTEPENVQGIQQESQPHKDPSDASTSYHTPTSSRPPSLSNPNALRSPRSHQRHRRHHSRGKSPARKETGAGKRRSSLSASSTPLLTAVSTRSTVVASSAARIVVAQQGPVSIEDQADPHRLEAHRQDAELAVSSAATTNFSRPLTSEVPLAFPCFATTTSEVQQWTAWSHLYPGGSEGMAYSAVPSAGVVEPNVPATDGVDIDGSVKAEKAPSTCFPIVEGLDLIPWSGPSNGSGQGERQAGVTMRSPTCSQPPKLSRSSLEGAMAFFATQRGRRSTSNPPDVVEDERQVQPPAPGGSSSTSTSAIVRWAQKATKRSRDLLGRKKGSTPVFEPVACVSPSAIAAPAPAPLEIDFDPSLLGGAASPQHATNHFFPDHPGGIHISSAEEMQAILGSYTSFDPLPVSAASTFDDWSCPPSSAAAVPPPHVSPALRSPPHPQFQQQQQQPPPLPQKQQGPAEQTSEPTFKLNGEYTAQELLLLAQGRVK